MIINNLEARADAVPLYPVDRAARLSHKRLYFRGNLAALAVVLLALGLARTAVVADGGLWVFGCRLPETCLSKLILGRPCIGCGLTRSVVLAVADRWTESRALHPGGIWLAGWLVLQTAARAALLPVQPSRPIVWQVDLGASLVSLLAVLYVPPTLL